MTTAEQAPPYPEYPELLAEATKQALGFIHPAELRDFERAVGRRGHDWACGVLGKAYNPRAITYTELLLILAADAADIHPPLPPLVVEQRAEAARHRAEQDARQKAFAEREQAAWDKAREGLVVEVQVRPNARTASNYRGFSRGHLRHVTPTVDVHTGSTRKPRLHRAGRPLCETLDKPGGIVLGEPTDQPATCVRCLTHTPRVRPADG